MLKVLRNAVHDSVKQLETDLGIDFDVFSYDSESIIARAKEEVLFPFYDFIELDKWS